jgi:drug/metabolite transporter (DMT)-like permease
MRLSRTGLFSLAVIYLVWGSTFLAIRVAVTGEGFGPYILASIRTLLAGLCLLAVGLLQGHSLRARPREIGWLFLSGFFLWVGGHTLLIWASQRVDSGLAALLFASIPLWTFLLTLRRIPVNLGKLAPVLVGFAGVAFVFPIGSSALGFASLLDGGAVLLSAFLWSLGTVLGTLDRMAVAVTSGYQLLFAGMVNMLIAYSSGEVLGAPDARAWIACAYLVIPGCVLAFLAYSHALRVLPLPIVMSFAYVNPLVAVVLGILVLGESLTLRVAFGCAVILGSVFWLLRTQEGKKI